jgi:HK97 family phage major capsid protein
MKDTKDMRQKRLKLVEDSRALLDKAEKENRKMTAEETQHYDRMFTDIKEAGDDIQRYEQQAELERQMAASQGQQGGRPDPADASAAAQRAELEKKKEQEIRSAYRKFLLNGLPALNEREHTLFEERALQAGSDPAGGYLVAPVQWVNELIKAVDDMLFIRSLATRFPVLNAASLGVPTLDNDPADSDWTSELGTGSADSTMSFGKRELKPHPLAKSIKVSNKLLRSAAMNVEAIVQARLAYKFAVSQEKGFMTGNGVDKPLGIFTASADGVPTSRDVSAGNTTTLIKMDGLIAAKYSLKAQYQAVARWLFHRDAMKQISQLTDGQGQYLWQPSLQAGQPDRLLGLPIMMSEYVPNTFTTALYVGMLADFSWYWIADALDMQVQRLVELYAETNQTGYIGRLETDGMPVLAEAFARVKLA